MAAVTKSDFFCNMRPRTFYALLAVCWLLLSLSFIATLPAKNFFGYDMGAHVQYTRYIKAEKQLPSTWHGWQTYQPPAYYLVNQLLFPFSKYHVTAVRMSSIVYGAVFLLACHLCMNYWAIPKAIQLLSLLYFMSMPAFLYLFTAYNNDALAMAVAATVSVLVLVCYHKPKFVILLLLFLLSALGVYTKYSLVLVYAAIGCVILAGVVVRRIRFSKALIIIVPLLLGCLTLLPYLHVHNFANTGRHLPSNFDLSEIPDWNIRHHPGTVRFFLTPPGITTGEWTYPYAFDEKFHSSLEPVMFYWTKKNYLSSLLTTSLFGEFNYSARVPAADKWAWVGLWLHIILLANIRYLDKSNQVLSGFLIVSLTVFAFFIMFSHYGFNSVNFRLCAWINLPLTALAATALSRRLSEKGTPATVLLVVVIVAGIFSHVFYQFTLNASLP